MKKFFKSAMYASLLVVALSFTSCQEESPVEIQVDDEKTLVASSATAKLIEHTVSNDGSFDNIVDGASCFDIRFPYTVEINGIRIEVNSKEDMELIENIFDAIDDDNDILEILFPITITTADYSEIKINGNEDLRAIAEECIEGGDDDDIECIDVVYPVTLFTYDPNREQTGSVTMNSDRELRRFLAGLSLTDIIGFDFPIVLEIYDNTKITVNNNSELANAVERAKGACDEDDDNDYNDDDFTQGGLNNLLVECPWLVEEVERNDQDIDQYENYQLNFKEDGSVTARDRDGNLLNGEWSTRVVDHQVRLKLEFETMVDFNLEWYINEIDEDEIELYFGEENEIELESNCGG